MKTLGLLGAALALLACNTDAPEGLRRTPSGPGATVRFDLAHTPLPDIPIPNDTATWQDPTSRTGLRINASLIAPTEIERDARRRFDQLEGWGTFAPITVSFDLAEVNGEPRPAQVAALDLVNIQKRHGADDYDFFDDAVYLVNLDTGVPVPLDMGNGNFDYTLKRLDRYWPNDTHASERNLLFETRDESARGALGFERFTAALDQDQDGILDVPNLDDPFACPDPDVVCDDASNMAYGSDECLAKRRKRDQCIADHLLRFYERETDTLILRPLLPMDEMTRYAVVITDRLIDANGDAVRSPFDFVYHASQEAAAEAVLKAIDDETHANYFGDIAGTGLDHVAFTWVFTTQPTVDDMKRLRDGLYGKGAFKTLAKEFPIEMELRRAVGRSAGLENGSTDPDGWRSDEAHGCPEKQDNLFVIKADDIKGTLKTLVIDGFGESDGPATQALLKSFDAIDYIAVGTFASPFFLEGGPENTDPKAAFSLDYQTGAGTRTRDEVQVFIVVPKETAQFKQPFDVNIYGHGYTGAFIELILYAGNLAQHGLATVGINAMGHGLDFGDDFLDLAVESTLEDVCVGPFKDSLVRGRARDLDRDGRPNSGGDFWSSYLFHTRDGVRQSILDHIQLVRIMRAFGTTEGRAVCRSDATGWATAPTASCDVNADGVPETFGDFDGNGTPDFGGPQAHYGTWGESLGGILSAIHGAIDAYVTSASPGSGGGGLTDIGIRSFQGGVIEAVLLRLWGPLLVTVPAKELTPCDGSLDQGGDCTSCPDGQMSLRWVMPDTDSTGELEIDCLDKSEIQNTTVLVYNDDSGELRCGRLDDDAELRVGIPSSVGDRITLRFYDGVDGVEDYDSCRPTFPLESAPRTQVTQYGAGRHVLGTSNATETASCESATCNSFQGLFFGEGTRLVAPAEGLGQRRQTPGLRRFIQLAQTALEPGDPVSFAPYYSIKPMTDPFGARIAPHAVLTLNTIGDMNVPLNSGIAFARATGALPFLRPEHAAKYPEYAPYVTPAGLFAALGDKTPNRDLVDTHVIEGITELARHPAGAACATSANALPLDATFIQADGTAHACFPTGCTEATEQSAATRVCFPRSHCDVAAGRCVPDVLGQRTCDEALYDADELDETTALYFEEHAPVPHRLVRYTQEAHPGNIDEVWAPRLRGAPFGEDLVFVPDPGRPLTALLDAYVVPQGVHTFVNGNPCESFDAGTYLTNLVARFFQTNGTDIYYVSHPKTHHCLGKDVVSCGYLDPR